jgi:O-antigen chain-terminating methyltransferase
MADHKVMGGGTADPGGVPGRKLMGLRRRLARFVLVDEERDRRRDDVSGAEHQAAENLEREMATLHVELDRIKRENSAILRLIGDRDGPGEPGADADGSGAPGLTARAFFAEVERGSREEVMARLRVYLDDVRGHEPVLDLGCGRGEFLQVAREAGIGAYGVDLDVEATAACRASGLDARDGDLFDHLAGLPEGELGAVFSAQVVEHLPAERLGELFRLIARALRTGGVIIVETPNPGTFATLIQSFWRDPTHVRPVPPPALGLAARSAGLVVQEVRYLSRPPEEERLQPIRSTPPDPDLREVVDSFNQMAGRLNEFLYGYQDYALVATKPG